ncbi:MAG: SRPBCC family protein, partial [Pseudonocardia sp.]|nr:SRPBCC family protein [Pseudonocardia sp.]
MDTSRKIQVSKVINASPKEIFALLSDPARHPDLDGSGMVRGVEGDPQPLIAIGQSFTMNMHQDALGDYRMVNSVTAMVPEARIGWEPRMDPTCELASKLGDMQVGGHTFTFDLRAVDGGTKVTETYDWMSVKDEKFLAMLPIVSEEDMKGSLDKLSESVT